MVHSGWEKCFSFNFIFFHDWNAASVSVLRLKGEGSFTQGFIGIPLNNLLGTLAMALGETVLNHKVGYRSVVPQNEITYVFYSGQLVHSQEGISKYIEYPKYLFYFIL